MELGEVKGVKGVIATLEVIDDTLAGETTSRTDVVNFDNFDNFISNFGNFDNFSSNSDNFDNFDRSSSARFYRSSFAGLLPAGRKKA